MAEGKKGFIMYADQKEIFDQLSDLKAGKLIKHIFKYVNDENPKTDDMIINLAFTPIKTQLKRDLKHWENIREQRSKAGKLGGRPKKQKETKKPNALFDKQTKAKKAVIVNDIVKVKVIDNVKEIINNMDFDFKNELINYCIYLKESFSREIGQMQIEQMIRMLDSWYDSKNKKVLCLAANISNGWKTLNYVNIEDSKKINYDIQ